MILFIWYCPFVEFEPALFDALVLKFPLRAPWKGHTTASCGASIYVLSTAGELVPDAVLVRLVSVPIRDCGSDDDCRCRSR